jgi:hypothetical protein
VAIAGRVDGEALPSTSDALSEDAQGDGDAFLAVFDGMGTELRFSSFVGGTEVDSATDLAHGRDGEIYIIGDTSSTDFPLAEDELVGQGNGFAMLFAGPNTLGPVPEVHLNGEVGFLVLRLGEPFSVDVSLLPRDAAGTEADWWVAANTPSGWYSYRGELAAWVSVGDSHLNLVPTFQQRPLENLAPLRVKTAEGGGLLGPGRYGVYFGVDTLPNGVIDMDHIAFTRAIVEIEE